MLKDGYREGPWFNSHLRCTARLFFVMGAYGTHGLLVVIDLSFVKFPRRREALDASCT